MDIRSAVIYSATMTFRLLVFAGIGGWLLPSYALGQSQPTCPKGFQPYANRCISQRMADYISCVEASGGNSERVATEVTNAKAGNTGVGVKGSGSGLVLKGSGSVTVDRATEQALASKFEQTWTSQGMEECRKVLDPPGVTQPKKQSSLQPAQAMPVQAAGNTSCCDWIVGRWRASVPRFSERVMHNVDDYTDHVEWRWTEDYALEVAMSSKSAGRLAGSYDGMAKRSYTIANNDGHRFDEKDLDAEPGATSRVDVRMSPADDADELKIFAGNCKSDDCAWVAKASSTTEFVARCLSRCEMSLFGWLTVHYVPVQQLTFVKQ